MSMLGQKPSKKEIVLQLARLYDTAARADTLLSGAGFNRSMLPRLEHPQSYWDQVFDQIDGGLGSAAGEDDGDTEFLGGIYTLMEATRPYHPLNRVFQAALAHYAPASVGSRGAPTANEGNERQTAVVPVVARAAPLTEGALLAIRTDGQGARRRFLRDRLAEIARQRGIELVLLEETGTLVRWHLPRADVDTALGLRDELVADPHLALNIAATSAARASLPDPNINRLLVEGPDQGLYELNDVPRNTRVGSVAQAIVSNYNQSWPTDSQHQPRSATVNVAREDGTLERLHHQATLDEAGVGENAQLSVHPESTAGSVNPRLRDEALVRAKVQITAFATGRAGFVVHANSRLAPTYYELQFDAPSFAPPPTAGASPVPVGSHAVSLELPPDFPMVAPSAVWKTPIFHPNIHPKHGNVCLGALADRYRPGLDFGELCQTLIDIASFANYETREGYNRDAAEWILTPEGQSAIERIGGRTLHTSDAQATPNTAQPILKIRRISP